MQYNGESTSSVNFTELIGNLSEQDRHKLLNMLIEQLTAPQLKQLLRSVLHKIAKADADQTMLRSIGEYLCFGAEYRDCTMREAIDKFRLLINFDNMKIASDAWDEKH